MAIDVNRAKDQSSSSSQSLTMRTLGFKSLEGALLRFANDFDYKSTEKNVLVPAVREAIKPIRDAIKAFAPRSPDAGRKQYKDPKAAKHLQDTVRSTARVPNAKDRRSQYVAGNDIAIGEASIFTDQRGMAQEFGTRAGLHKKVPTTPQPFLRQSVTYAAVAALDTFENKLLEKIASYRNQNELTPDPR